MAPAFIARTVVGISPWPVMKTMGISLFASTIRRCKSSPLRSGNCTSSTRQLGASVRARLRNASADANASTLSPADRTRRPSASRTEASSSTMNTMSGVSVISASHGELERRTGPIIRNGPESSAVLLDDRTADRETHSHARGLRGVERIEYAGRELRVDAGPRVPHRDTDMVGRLRFGADDQLARAVQDFVHGVQPVQQKVEHDLLQLNAVADHARERSGELGPDPGVCPSRFTLGKGDHLRDDVVDIERLLVGTRSTREGSNPSDHLARPPPVARDRVQAVVHFTEIG